MNEKPLLDRRKRIAKKVIISVVCVFVLVLLIVPPVIVYMTISGHVDYGVIEDHPLQNMYSPSDFGLTANEMMLTTEDGYNIWASEVYTENPKGNLWLVPADAEKPKDARFSANKKTKVFSISYSFHIGMIR